MKLETSVKAYFDDIQGMIDEIKRLQTYKLFEGDDMVLVDLDAVVAIMANHIRADKCSEFPNSSDTIYRQAAIDIERNATVDTNPSHFEAHQKFKQFMDDAEISSFGRWQWSNGFNTALTAVGIDLKKLPSAQPERKKGSWNVIQGDIVVCSKCGMLAPKSMTGCLLNRHLEPNRTNFCPNCGADMRGEGEQE